MTPPPSDMIAALHEFVAYAARLQGNERKEAQLFLEHLFRAFGHAGVKEAGAEFEKAVKRSGRGQGFIDLVWKPRLLVEMKSRGERLERHYRQAFDYWVHLVPNRPRYVVLCNFDEIWIYDFDKQVDEPLDKIRVAELPEHHVALAFLRPVAQEPIFKDDRVAVTRDAADKVAKVFNALVQREIPREQAQRFILQCVVALFSEDLGLLPDKLFTRLLEDCRKGESSYDVIGGLFRQMNDPTMAPAGRYRAVPYFNGGIFSKIEPLHLDWLDVNALQEAAAQNWSRVNPAVFGTLFQASMDAGERHAFGAHYTHEVDIQKVVMPTIVRPWRERIENAGTVKELLALAGELRKFAVLDPACGSGNFLYVAYRELRRIEVDLLEKIRRKAPSKAHRAVLGHVTLQRFHGFDVLPFAVELAKVTLMLAKELSAVELQDAFETIQQDLGIDVEPALPLDNLDDRIKCQDALFVPWPAVNAIIGNPPFQSKNKMQKELGAEYVRKLRAAYPGVPGRADYCVYFFRKAHDQLPGGGRAGLVGTNTIRQNYSREGGLDYIVANGGTIVEAVSTQEWSGDAAVHVSIVNWIKAPADYTKRLAAQLENKSWEVHELRVIPSSLTAGLDVTTAASLKVNRESGACYQGQTHGHEGFIVPRPDAETLIRGDARLREVMFPFLTADELLSETESLPTRYVIDFQPRDLFEAERYGPVFARVKHLVLPDRKEAAEEEERRNAEARATNPKAKVNRHHGNFLARWWLLSWPRPELMASIAKIPRYIACGQVTKRPIFEFISSDIHPNAALIAFPLPDDYSFGILQSLLHWEWFKARCSTLEERFRYTSDTVFDSFPWPQTPSVAAIRAVADAAVALRKLRREVMARNAWSLRDLYRSAEVDGRNPLKDVQAELDRAVAAAYGMPTGADPLRFILDLNAACADRESRGESIVGPGIPPSFRNAKSLVTQDAVRMSRS